MSFYVEEFCIAFVVMGLGGAGRKRLIEWIILCASHEIEPQSFSGLAFTATEQIQQMRGGGVVCFMVREEAGWRLQSEFLIQSK